MPHFYFANHKSIVECPGIADIDIEKLVTDHMSRDRDSGKQFCP
jgi:hypothetical protein